MDTGISHDAGNKEQEQPHEALYFVLAYLPLLELLTMNQVCRSLREALTNDILPWLHIIIEKPLNLRLSNNILMKITARANGKLRTLVLNSCSKITDDGLQGVISQNPCIIKLHVPACTSLTPEGVIRAVRTLTVQNCNLRSLRINGIHSMSKEHLEMLHSLLCINQTQQHQKKSCNIYPEYKHVTILRGETNHPSVDVDICPRCDNVRMVFDCPRETCMRNRVQALNPQGDCRGCIKCIPRCVECGGCVEFEEDCEAACFDLLCTTCWLQLPKCNFCNKPYCNQHSYQQCILPGSSGFLCDACHAKFITNLSL